MSTVAARSGARRVSAPARVERRKLLAQLPVRLLAALCVLGPFTFAVLLEIQSSTPADALFGVYAHASGFALSLVVLAFAANWAFPIIAGIVAGDLFAAEDRQGTWKTMLTRSRSLGELFAAKVMTGVAVTVVLGAALGAASIVAGAVLVGGHSLVGFGGTTLSAGHVLELTALSWLVSLPPLAAYACLAILFSVASRSGIAGVLGPVLVALLTQLLNLVGSGVWVHLLLIGSAFDGWHGLFAARPFFGPLLVSLAVCAAWIAASLGAAAVILRRREFVAGAGARLSGWRRPARTAAIAVAAVAVLALATSWGPAGVTAGRLRSSFTSEFHHLTILQQRLLGHPIPAGAHYRILPVCNRRGGGHTGPGDWSCTMNVYVVLPGTRQPLTDTPVSYDVTVQSNGCYKATSPPAYVGQAEIRDTAHRLVVNPLVTIYGCLNVL